jgi:hypothetical protein
MAAWVLAWVRRYHADDDSEGGSGLWAEEQRQRREDGRSIAERRRALTARRQTAVQIEEMRKLRKRRWEEHAKAREQGRNRNGHRP